METAQTTDLGLDPARLARRAARRDDVFSIFSVTKTLVQAAVLD